MEQDDDTPIRLDSLEGLVNPLRVQLALARYRRWLRQKERQASRQQQQPSGPEQPPQLPRPSPGVFAASSRRKKRPHRVFRVLRGGNRTGGSEAGRYKCLAAPLP